VAKRLPRSARFSPALLLAAALGCASAPPPVAPSPKFVPADARVLSSPVTDSDVPGVAASDAEIVVYGAAWCSACAEIRAYCKAKGISCEHRDVERDPYALREMDIKLAAAGMSRGSIPVLDVRGQLIIGFNVDAVDAALRRSH
jgi:glutaredoxin